MKGSKANCMTDRLGNGYLILRVSKEEVDLIGDLLGLTFKRDSIGKFWRTYSFKSAEIKEFWSNLKELMPEWRQAGI